MGELPPIYSEGRSISSTSLNDGTAGHSYRLHSGGQFAASFCIRQKEKETEEDRATAFVMKETEKKLARLVIPDSPERLFPETNVAASHNKDEVKIKSPELLLPLTSLQQDGRQSEM